jgi:transposase
LGPQTGANPTDRAKRGSKRHLICDGRGIPLAIELTGANCRDSTQALPLLAMRNTENGSGLGRRAL